MSTSNDDNTIKMITLTSSDGQSLQVEEHVVCESETINNIIEDGCSDNGIPLPNVTGPILAKVLQYCKKHVETDTTDKVEVATLKKWDSDFMKIDQVTLYDLIMASNYLNVKGLLDLTCQTVANIIKGRNPEEIRKTFGIVNDFTPEQEEEIRKENEWAFE